ncbi:MAG: hypothetical protein A4E52_00587 [Pelotomaculum sp. PtaB.Bin013]|uniref:Uncharacterized protein n=1 Tax=Pelotomaculum isophthalicicum JI TaxID=947010 RepID=A0A9X4JT90_9FIRM|nr:hypothetical protein [Pelotomaculum isophthalicicum]MDF9407105.1 hypothetical protein [Pelotomaculum isophthalicicum JI]OPX91168.1 MAG: hypothetical protein A4E52_00587 [Pelotomaculum sp. PtaB.Bin013]
MWTATAGNIKSKVDEKSLSKKYRTNVGRLIKAFKLGLSDQEIADRTGVKLSTIYLIKQDIELLHRRLRLAKKKQELAEAQTLGKHQIFFNPLIK